MRRLLEGEAHLRPPGDRDSRRRQACANEKTISTHELATASRAAARERGSLRDSVLCAIATVTTIAGTAAGTAADSVVPVAPVAPAIRERRRRSPRASSSAALRSACSSRREEEAALQPTERAVESGRPSRETGTRVAVASTAPSPGASVPVARTSSTTTIVTRRLTRTRNRSERGRLRAVIAALPGRGPERAPNKIHAVPSCGVPVHHRAIRCNQQQIPRAPGRMDP
ncbi:hypothetical protein C5D50_02500 [Rathayibacter sp. RFBD1]|nr:hypothetical protein C5D50_02500 [Rathayibacter sp. RFBD1]PPI62691.1 hypothetical protein C5D38_02060 [Rathayibacter sp. TRS19]